MATYDSVVNAQSSRITVRWLMWEASIGAQAAQALAVHLPGGPLRRTRHSGWTAALPQTTPLLEGCSAGDLCYCMEFLQARKGRRSDPTTEQLHCCSCRVRVSV